MQVKIRENNTYELSEMDIFLRSYTSKVNICLYSCKFLTLSNNIKINNM